jgi:hypothetical protein
MQVVDAYNNVWLCTLYTKFLNYCCFYTYISLCYVCVCVYIYTHIYTQTMCVYIYTHIYTHTHTNFEFVGSNTSRYNRILMFISHCGVSSKQTLAESCSWNVNTQERVEHTKYKNFLPKTICRHHANDNISVLLKRTCL